MSTTPKTTPARTLIVGDQTPQRTRLRHALEAAGHAVVEARDEPEATRLLRAARPVVVLTDLVLPTGSGFGVLRAAKGLDPDLAVIVMTVGGIEDAVAAMKEGALDCLAKPVDPVPLLLLVERTVERSRTAAAHLLLKGEMVTRQGVPRIVGQDPALLQVLTNVERAAATDATVLLEGKSGTGKELFARTLHAFSRRAGCPFVAINCAAIPENLLESELFGHEKGAFTGAVARKLGKFEVAHGSTLFLDEIGDLPVVLQPKILRAVESMSFERIGGTKSLQVDVRLVAATNQDLRAQVAAGEFREDLFFCLSVFPIQIPPLRERSADVPLLARFFIERFCADFKKPPLTLSPAAEDRLTSYAGQETCGSCRTASNARSSSATSRRSVPSISTWGRARCQRRGSTPGMPSTCPVVSLTRRAACWWRWNGGRSCRRCGRRAATPAGRLIRCGSVIAR